MLKSIIIKFCVTEIVHDECNIRRLIVLLKKGNLLLLNNYRGIMLLEIAYKIIAIILHARLLSIEESLDHESVCGFRPKRGCMDCIFRITMVLQREESMV